MSVYFEFDDPHIIKFNRDAVNLGFGLTARLGAVPHRRQNF